MKPKFYQFNCEEKKGLDLRQANAVLKHKPDVIILEYPCDKKTPGLKLNDYPPLKKPKTLVNERLKEFPAELLKTHPWAKADTFMWKNVARLWSQDHQVLMYAVDAPHELTSEWLDVWRHTYPGVMKNWIWWVQIYLRERVMADRLESILAGLKGKQSPIILIFLQDFHWKHVKFLLTNPGKEKIWQYYFGRFPEISKSSIAPKIKKLNKVFYKYWLKVSDF